MRSSHSGPALLLALFVGFLAAACGGGGDGSQGPPGPQGPPGNPGPPGDDGDGVGVFGPTDKLPGVVVKDMAASGGSGPGGNFLPGDTVTVTFRLETEAGDPLTLAGMSRGEIYMSGPTFYDLETDQSYPAGGTPVYPDLRYVSYQRVLLSQVVLPNLSNGNPNPNPAVDIGGGVYQYTFAAPIPANYLPPIGDSATFGIVDGELAGLPLLDGTYTIGMRLYKTYTIDGEDFRDPAAGILDVLLGDTAAVVLPREVVANANCNACHVEIRAHGEGRPDVRLCLLCHTAGAQDNGSDGHVDSIEFAVMIHKIHNGKHLPSVNGLTTDAAGNRVYGAGTPYEVAGHDYSEVGFPVWPSLNIGSLRDLGYSGLAAPNKAKEDEVLRGVIACAKCHGDPDAAGPAGVPLHGSWHEEHASRGSCGSCHDDLDYTKNYVSNGDTMFANFPNAVCNLCHGATTGVLPVRPAHTHPLLNPATNPGVVLTVTGVSRGTVAVPLAGTFQPGDKMTATFTSKDYAGNDVAPSGLDSISVVLSGPTTNYNLVLNGSVTTSHPNIQGAAASYTLQLPERIVMEWVGTSGPGFQTFTFQRSPLYGQAGMAPVLVRDTGVAPGGGFTTSAAASALYQNFLDVNTPLGFAKDDYVVVDGLGAKEYVRVALVQGSRLWFTTAMRFAHGAGALVVETTVSAAIPAGNFALNVPANGQITETTEFGNGDILALSYTSDFVWPALYPAPINDSPDLDASWGEWKGMPVVDGTFTVDLWAVRYRHVNYDGVLKQSGGTTYVPAPGEEITRYSGTSDAGDFDFLFDNPVDPGLPVLEPYDIISSGNNCYLCHDDLYFHGGGRRGFGTCIVCHGDAGGEDRPQYVAANAPATPKTSIAFREMLHKIHRGEDLPSYQDADPANDYTVVGFGSTPYPNNFTAYKYDHVVFPPIPGGVKNCVRCHGNDAFHEPESRDHPVTGVKTRVWAFVCGSCHESPVAHAHIDVNTTPAGAEACSVCHGPGADWAVEAVHFVR